MRRWALLSSMATSRRGKRQWTACSHKSQREEGDVRALCPPLRTCVCVSLLLHYTPLYSPARTYTERVKQSTIASECDRGRRETEENRQGRPRACILAHAHIDGAPRPSHPPRSAFGLGSSFRSLSMWQGTRRPVNTLTRTRTHTYI